MDKILSLKKDLSWFDCAAIITGIIIGTGIFSVFPGLIAMQNTSTGLILLAWIVGGVFAWFGAMCYAELSSIFPHAGGDYTFLHKAYSLKGENLVSFLFAWAKVFVIRPANIVILALIFGNEIQNIMFNYNIQLWNGPFFLALALIFILTFINIIGVKEGKTAQNLITGLKFLIVFFIVGFGGYKIISGLMQSPENISRLSPLIFPEDKPAWSMVRSFWSALVFTMWVYGGWNEAAYVAEEVKEPSRDIPKALFAGLFSVTILYAGINLVYLYHFSPKGLIITQNPANNLMIVWFGAKGGLIMSSIIAISAAGATNGLIMTGGRISYAFASNTPALRVFSKIHPKHRTPMAGLVANFVLIFLVLIISKGSMSFVDNLLFYTAGVHWYFFALVIISLIIFRTKISHDKIPFKVPFYPYAPILFLIITGSLIWGSIQYKAFETLVGISILTLGIPIYYLLHFDSPQCSLHLSDAQLPLDDENSDRRQNAVDRRQNIEDRRKAEEERRKQNIGRDASEE